MSFKDKIYNYDVRIKGILKRIQNSDLCEENKKDLLSFYRECVIQGLSKARIAKYLDTLQRLAQWLVKPFSQVEREDIENTVQYIESRDYTNWTKHDYKVILKIFFRWLRKTDDYPEEVRWIKATPKNGNKLPEELLSPDEVRKIVEAANNLRDKALILVLYETGCRIGELLTLQQRHVQFDEYGAVLLVNGKVGQRRVRIILSAPKLSQWIENHPLRDNPDAPLWVTIGTNSRNRVLTYATAKELLKDLARKAGIKKRVHPHLFRHSRATNMSNFLTEAQMNQYFGWVQGSNMPSIYVHLSGRDVDKALLKLNGVEVPEEMKEETFLALTCPRCKMRNSPDAKFCSKCGLCLDVKTAVVIDETKARVDKLMTELVKRPNVLNHLLKAIEEISE